MIAHRPLKRRHDFHKITYFLKQNVVLIVAFIAALASSLVVPPDEKYLSYLDFRTLTCLFCTLAVICGLRNIKFFTVVARKLVSLSGSTRKAVIALLMITFIGSMLIANDMALITFLPLGYIALSETGNKKYLCYTFIMQNIAANLGGMVTPFGNPQNLFLYNKFNIPTGEFTLIMLPPFLLSITLILLSVFVFVKNEKLELNCNDNTKLPIKRTVAYLLLFAFSLLIVFRLIPFVIGLILIPAAMIILDRKALKDVDYGLLFTFVFFFIFAGNMARIDVISNVLSDLMQKNALIFSSLSCQFISNVPSAILLSEFTENYKDLLIGVNIGGTGTLIASLASLITFRQYQSVDPQGVKKYFIMFSLINFSFLGILMIFCSLI
ncbi:MAG: citrate transporter [Ruminococcaceae bacterium]|nr:citrate transporter [Oscillospiraceae bacterium]